MARQGSRRRTELLQAGEALQGLLAAAVRQVPREISLSAGSVLRTVERTGPRRITDLAALEQVTQPSMTALVTTLERAGLVERQRDAHDQRTVLVALTDRGRGYIKDRRVAGAEAFVRLLEKLSPAEMATVQAAVPALRRLRDLEEEQWRPMAVQK